jgi:hypothetical protein
LSNRILHCSQNDFLGASGLVAVSFKPFDSFPLRCHSSLALLKQTTGVDQHHPRDFTHISTVAKAGMPVISVTECS